MSDCPHHWVLGDLVEGPPDTRSEKGRLSYRASTCKLCGEERVLKERETNYISKIETESI